MLNQIKKNKIKELTTIGTIGHKKKYKILITQPLLKSHKIKCLIRLKKIKSKN